MQKQRQDLSRLEREKRITLSANCDTSMLQTAQRSMRGERRILGSLSVVMGGGKKGQIVVRDGDDIGLIVRNFI